MASSPRRVRARRCAIGRRRRSRIPASPIFFNFPLDIFPGSLYFVEMPKGDYLGEFEQIVMLAVLRLERDAYGMEVRREIELRTGRDASIGAVYATLDRLETKGLVRSRDLEPRGNEGRPRRLYKVTAAGGRALEKTQVAVARMWEGVRVPGPVQGV
jgi:PadR family transcriptional regulator, regulatory protein PadR